MKRLNKKMLLAMLCVALVVSFVSVTALAYGTIRNGSKGDDVRTLQSKLNELGYSLTVDGAFGPKTEASVKQYQQSKGLDVDGIVGPKTWAALMEESSSGAPPADTPSQDNSSTVTPDPSISITLPVKQGMRGENVKLVQQALKNYGQTMDVDGIFGSKTKAGVVSFQQANSLEADGIVGSRTWAVLKNFATAVDGGTNSGTDNGTDSDNNTDSGTTTQPETPPAETVDPNTVKLGKVTAELPVMVGSTGDTVIYVQRALKNCGYNLAVDGQYGTKTADCVVDYQKTFGLEQTGMVDAATWKRMQQVENFIEIAETRLGCPYVYGGKGPDEFDCSGLVYWVMNQAGIKQTYMNSDAWQKNTTYTKIASMSDLERGDIISFEGHVGIYLGSGKMIDASNSTSNVRIMSNVTSLDYWKNIYVCGFRIYD